MSSPSVIPVDPGADVRFLSGVLAVTPPFRVYFRCEALLSVSSESKRGVQPGGAVEDLLSAPVAGVEVDAIIDGCEQGDSYRRDALPHIPPDFWLTLILLNIVRPRLKELPWRVLFPRAPEARQGEHVRALLIK